MNDFQFYLNGKLTPCPEPYVDPTERRIRDLELKVTLLECKLSSLKSKLETMERLNRNCPNMLFDFTLEEK
jgi:hypothetical protein